jgi:hypothetical protein
VLILAGLLMFSHDGLSQQANGSGASIQKSFSAVALAAYQESSISKVNDFYSYLEILAMPETSAELAQQLEQNIMTMFVDETEQVLDFTSATPTLIPVKSLLQKLRNTALRFSVKASPLHYPVFQNYWLSQYSVEVKNNEKVTALPVRQRVYLQLRPKLFGDKSKITWDMALGEMEP